MITIDAKMVGQADFPDDESIASDAYVLITVDGAEWAWGDDYGTAHPPLSCPPGTVLEPDVKEACEKLLEAASNTWSC